MSGKRKAFVVEVPMPDGVSATEMRDYIRDAVMGWCGQFEAPHDDNPGNPLFGLRRQGPITIRPYRKTAE